MANRRMLAASISVSEQVAALDSDFARLLFTWMIAHADDYGVLSGSPAKVRALVVPMLDVTVAAVADALADMERNELIWRYLADDGQAFIQFRTWETHQQGLHKRTAPRLPQWRDISGDGERFPELPGTSRNFPLKVKEKGIEEKRTEREGNTLVVMVDDAAREKVKPAAAVTTTNAEAEIVSLEPALTAQVADALKVGRADQGTLQRILLKHRRRGLSSEDVLIEVGKLEERARASPRRPGVSVAQIDNWLARASPPPPEGMGRHEQQQQRESEHAATGTDGAAAQRGGAGAGQPPGNSGQYRRASAVQVPDPTDHGPYAGLFRKPTKRARAAQAGG